MSRPSRPINLSMTPLVLFVYNRPKHTLKVLNALQHVRGISDTDLYIYSDGPPAGASEESLNRVRQVREIITCRNWAKHTKVYEAPENLGLATSVINGVSQVLSIAGRVIVLEDDLIPATDFLSYMNNALNRYECDDRVKQVSGFGFPLPGQTSFGASYFIPIASTWGWGTWSRVWDEIDFSCAGALEVLMDKVCVRKFNMDGAYNYHKMLSLDLQSSGRVSSWGIRFYWHVFSQNGVVLYPDESLVRNIGWDGSGRHGDSFELFSSEEFETDYEVVGFPECVEIDKARYNIIRRNTKKQTSVVRRIWSKIRLGL